MNKAAPSQEPYMWLDEHGMTTSDPFEGVTPLYTHPSDAAAQIVELTTLCDGWRKEAVAMERQIAKLEARIKELEQTK